MSPLVIAAVAALPTLGVLRFGVPAMRGLLLVRAARGWNRTSGVVTRSGVRQVTRGNSTVTETEVLYEFTLDRKHEGRTPRACGDMFISQEDAVAFVSRYPAGASVEVFYDPQDPTRNCLDRTDTSALKARLGIALLMLLAGAGLVAMVARR